jgi:xylulokinase
MRLNLDILEASGCRIRELRLIGGGAKSAAWSQLKADAIGKPVTTLNVTEAGCLGVAMLARCAVTSEDVRVLAKRWIRPVSRIEPQPDNAAVYEKRFVKYRELYPALRPLLSPSPSTFARAPADE